MNPNKNLHLSTKQFKKISGLFLTATAVLCTIFSLMNASSTAKAQGTPGGNITNQIVSSVDIAEPAVVRIITSVPAHLTVHFTANDSMAFPRNGGNYSLDLSGSGSFISSHGDIATADHVVHPPQADMTNYLYQLAAQDITDYLNNTYTTSPAYDVNQIYYALTTGTFRSEPHYDTPKSVVYLSTAYTGPENTKNFKNISKNNYAPIDSIKKESAPDLQDLAIIHIAMDDTPSIVLGDSTAISQQDELTIIGFPGNADITQKDDATQLLTSSVNKIYVSALKQNDDGTPLIQVSGNIEHGDSGGPALDSSGQIVGIVSFQKDSNGQPNNTSFLHVSQNIKQMVTILKLDITPGNFQKAWQQGFKDYASNKAGHWHKANQEFIKLASAYPSFNALKPFATYAAQQAKQERLPQQAPPKQTTSPYLPYLLGAFALLFLLIILGATLLLTKKKSKVSSMAGIQAYTPTTTTESSNYATPSFSNSSSWPPLSPTPPSIVPNQTAREATPPPIPTPYNQPIATPLPPTPSWDRPTPIPDTWIQPTSTPWNIPTQPQTLNNTNNDIDESRHEEEQISKQSGSMTKEQMGFWSNADGIINPQPIANPRYPTIRPYSIDDENTGVRKAIQPDQLNKQASSLEKAILTPSPEQLNTKQTSAQNNNESVHSRKKASDNHPWPSPVAWQQAGILSTDAEKDNSIKLPQAPPHIAPGARLHEYRNSKQL